MKIFILIMLSLSLSASMTEWKYKEWQVKRTENGTIKYTTHGEVAQGNEFGFIKNESNCESNKLWFTLYTMEEGLEKFKGKSVLLEVSSDKEKFNIEAVIVSIFPLGSTSNIVLISGFLANDNFMNVLKKGSKITLTVVAPTEIVKSFDIPYETFSLDGFTANHIKATEACVNPSALNIAPNIKKKVVLPVSYPVNNLIESQSECISLNTDTEIHNLLKFYAEFNNEYTLGNHYLFYGLGSDGYQKYPNIQIKNICNPSNMQDVTEIDNSQGQINKLTIKNNLLYAFYWDYFKIFDISDISDIKLLSKFELDKLSGDVAVAIDKVYVLIDKKLIVINTENIKKPAVELEILLDLENYSADEITFDDKFLYITGNNNLFILDRKTYSVLSKTSFPYRTSYIVIKDKRVYMKYWNNRSTVKEIKNGENRTGLAIINVSNPKKIKILKEDDLGYFSYMHQYGDYIFISDDKILKIKDQKNLYINQKNPTEQYNLAVRYYEGKDVKQDFQEAARLFTLSANQGNPDAQNLLGLMYKAGAGVKQDYNEAMKLLNQACDAKKGSACYVIGEMYNRANGVDKDRIKAVKYYREGCIKGNNLSCYFAGEMYSSYSKDTRDFKKAIEVYSIGCNNNDMDSCNALGKLYEWGENEKQDIQLAIKYFTKACEGGERFGCRNVADLYYRGNKVKKDKRIALEYYKKACDNEGYYDDCFRVGKIYYNGDGVRQNLSEAKKVFKNLCDYREKIGAQDPNQSVVKSCLYLGKIYNSKVKNNKQDKIKAKDFFGIACDRGNDESCNEYKILNEQGI